MHTHTFSPGDQIEVLLPKPFDHGFDYCVPEGQNLPCGAFVRVPFGKQTLTGIVWGKGEQRVAPEKLKPIDGVVEHLPPVKPDLREYVDWVSRYTMAPKGMVAKMVMPVADALEPPKPTPYYTLSGTSLPRATAAREAVVTLLQDSQPRTVADIYTQAAVSASVVKGLIEAGVLVEAQPSITKASAASPTPPRLSDAQAQAAKELASKLGQGFSVSLLDGVTGSGKTEVYFDTMERVLEQPHSQVLVLLPEIALSVQWVQRCEQRFGVKPTLWHSGLTPAQRRDAWREITTGKARLIVGARSALFLPYPNLQLIIVDEEHEPSYKQEEGVIYHARDMAVVRGHIEALPVMLVSATPSMETVYNVQEGRYGKVHLPHRHGGVHLPTVEAVDMREEKLDSGHWLSHRLREAIAETLANGRQAMLFLNRRGYAPLLLCRKCGYRFACEECSSWMVLHQSHGKLQCHHCGITKPVPKSCPSCGEEEALVACGPGVERVAEEAKALFPQARVEMMTSDTMTSLSTAQETVDAMTAGKIDILVGTQMMAKGYHFPNLHLIGVVDADLGLTGGDLRAAERTYQLLHQVAGRAGREGEQGRVLLQSYMPDHPVMEALSAHDRVGLEQLELTSREDAKLPPFGRMAAVIVDGVQETTVLQYCQQLARKAPMQDGIRVLGPAPAPLHRLRGRFRYRFLLQAEKHLSLQKYIHHWLGKPEHSGKLRVRIDIDPYSFL